jgi:hypothetical protein
VVDYRIADEGFMEPRLSVDTSTLDRIYDNGSIAVFLRRVTGC